MKKVIAMALMVATVLAAGVILVGCGRDLNFEDLSGRWNLTSYRVTGNGLNVNINSNSGEAWEALAYDFVEFREDGTFTWRNNGVEGLGFRAEETTGRWRIKSRRKGEVELRSGGQDHCWYISISGDTLTMNDAEGERTRTRLTFARHG